MVTTSLTVMSPEYLYDSWFKIEKKLKETSKIFLMLDYDGTIAPIVKKPELAKLNPKTKKILRKLLGKDRLKIAIVSGRSITQLKKFVSLKGLYYVGVHGLEIAGPSINFKHPDAVKLKPILVKAYKATIKKMGEIKGVLVENKGLTFAVHYRLTSKKDVLKIRKKIREIHVKYSGLKILKGKKVLEFIPNLKWDKSSAVQFLLEKFDFNFFPIYFGDDLTDESVFKTFKNKGLMVVVGKRKNSAAKYYVKNVGEVLSFLDKISKIF